MEQVSRKVRITAEGVDGYVELERGVLDAFLFTAYDNQEHMRENYTPDGSDEELKKLTDTIRVILNHIWPEYENEDVIEED